MIGRAIWAILCVALALATLQLQLDRQAAREPQYAAFVTEPFRANAQFIRTARALNREDTDAALAEARRLIARRPVPAEHLTLLAGVYFQDEDIEPASLAIQYAAQRGWRDPIAQEARLRLALEAGDDAEAARRFVALMLNQGTDNMALRNLGEAVFAGPSADAENVLVELASETDRWHSVLLRRGPAVVPPRTMANVIVRSLDRGAMLECGSLEQTLRFIERRDAASTADLRQSIDQRC